MSPTTVQINGQSVSICRQENRGLKRNGHLPKVAACEWYSLVGEESQDSQAPQPPGYLIHSLDKEGIPACIWSIPVYTSPLLHSLILEGSGRGAVGQPAWVQTTDRPSSVPQGASSLQRGLVPPR